ncbi:MAG: hypothetical protein ACOYXC_06400 [Candidatus Rifleibacteriota bacterium]
MSVKIHKIFYLFLTGLLFFIFFTNRFPVVFADEINDSGRPGNFSASESALLATDVVKVSDDNHRENHHHASNEEINPDGHHGHHHHAPGHVCPVCGGDHDESYHQKELERTKYETLEVKFEILKKKAISMAGLALVLLGLAWLNKRRGK